MPARARTSAHPIREFFFGNLTTKAMALFMALILWLYAWSISRENGVLAVPLDVETGPGWSWTLVGRNQASVDVELTFPRRLRQNVYAAQTEGRIRIVLKPPLSGSGPDRREVVIPLDEAYLRMADSLRASVKRFHPAELTIRLMREDTVELPVVPRLSDPPPGYQVKAQAMSMPPRVRVRGPKDALSRATGIETELLDISAVAPFIGSEWEDALEARLAQKVTVNGETFPVKCAATVRVRVSLIPIPKKRTFEKVPINLLRSYPYPYVAEPKEDDRATDVKVSGPASVVDTLKKEKIILYVDVRNLEPKELPWPLPIQAHISDTPGANDLTVKLEKGYCNVKISEPKKE